VHSAQSIILTRQTRCRCKQYRHNKQCRAQQVHAASRSHTSVKRAPHSSVAAQSPGRVHHHRHHLGLRAANAPLEPSPVIQLVHWQAGHATHTAANLLLLLLLLHQPSEIECGVHQPEKMSHAALIPISPQLEQRSYSCNQAGHGMHRVGSHHLPCHCVGLSAGAVRACMQGVHRYAIVDIRSEAQATMTPSNDLANRSLVALQV